MSQPLVSHWLDIKRILRYLNGTLGNGLLLQPAASTVSLPIHASCDAGWASDLDDRKFTSIPCIYIGSNLISWWSKKQQRVLKLNMEVLLSQQQKCYGFNLFLVSCRFLLQFLPYFVTIKAHWLFFTILPEQSTWNWISSLLKKR